MGALGTVRAEAAGHVQRELLRCDVRGKGAGTEDGFVLSRERNGGEEKGEKKERADHDPWKHGSAFAGKVVVMRDPVRVSRWKEPD